MKRANSVVLSIFLCCLCFSYSKNVFAFGGCSSIFPPEVTYLPSIQACGGKAGIVLTGRFINSFSVVVRSCDNGDRDPCYKNADACATNASSPFKVQRIYSAKVQRMSGKIVAAKINCLKEAGDSLIYTAVRRLTIKRVNPVQNPSTDVYKICLPSRTKSFNPVTILSVGGFKNTGNTGFNAQCLTQQYLGCDIPTVINQICPKK